MAKIAIWGFNHSLEVTLDMALDQYEDERHLTPTERQAVEDYHDYLRQSLADEIKGVK